MLVRGGFHGSGKAGDANRLKLRDAAANALEHASCLMVPVYADPALNERCYGDLQVVLISLNYFSIAKYSELNALVHLVRFVVNVSLS